MRTLRVELIYLVTSCTLTDMSVSDECDASIFTEIAVSIHDTIHHIPHDHNFVSATMLNCKTLGVTENVTKYVNFVWHGHMAASFEYKFIFPSPKTKILRIFVCHITT